MFELRFDVHYLGCDFSDRCLYYGELNALFNQQTLKIISRIESFLCPDKQGTPKEGWRIQRPKCLSIHHHKDKDNSPKNNNQNNTHVSLYH